MSIEKLNIVSTTENKLLPIFQEVQVILLTTVDRSEVMTLDFLLLVK